MKKIFSLFVITLFSVSMFATTWTVAGSPTTLFGSSWDPEDTNNDMELVDGLYTLSKSGVEMAAGEIAFKVCKDHAWDEAYPGSDYKVSISESGIYSVTITFNESTHDITANATKTGEAVVVPTIKLHGNFTGDWEDTEDFVIDGKKETASLTLTNLAAGNYEFGVKKDGSWVANGAAFTRNSVSHEVVAGSGNLSIAVDKAGNYTFTWTYATDSLSVVYPTLANSAVTISAPEHVTISVKNGEEAIGATVQELTQLTITASADAGYRVMSTSAYLTAKTDSTFTITDNKLLMPGAALTITAEVGLVDGYYLVGDFNDVPAWGIADLTPSKKLDVNPDNAEEYMIENVTLIADDSLKIANVVDNAIKWYAPNAANYVVDSDHAGSSKTVYYRPAGDGDAKWWYNCIYVPDNSGGTALDNTDAATKAVKRIVNGQLVIEREGKLFNALGAEVK